MRKSHTGKYHSIGNKFALIMVSISLLMSILLVGISSIRQYNSMHETLMKFAQRMHSDYDEMIKSEVETVFAQLTQLHESVENGSMSLFQAKKLAADSIRKIKYSDNGYFWVDDTKGMNIVLLGRSVEGTNRKDFKDSKGNLIIQEFIDTAQKNGEGYVDFYFPKEEGAQPLKKRGFVKYFKPFDWVVGTGNYIDDIEEKINQIRLEELESLKQSVILNIIISMIIMAAAIAISFAMGKKIKYKLAMVDTLLSETEKLNLRRRDDINEEIHKFNDETRSIGESAIKMREQLRLTYGLISSNSGILYELSQDIHQKSTTSKSAMQDISASMNQLAAGASNQAANIRKAVERLSGLNDKVSNITDDLKMINDETDQMLKLNKEGSSFMEQLSEKVLFTQKHTQDLNNEVAILSKNSDSIGEILNTIRAVADQTNLLALNAAIEAARAGESGKGFSVVAEEIRTLAEQTSLETTNISTILNEITNAIERTKNSMAQSIEAVNSSTSVMDHTKNSMSKIAHSAELTAGKIKQISNAVIEVDEGSAKVLEYIENISDVTQETASASEETSANIEVQNEFIQKLALSGEKLEEISNEFYDMTKKVILE